MEISFLTNSTPSFSPSNTTRCPICEIPLEEENIEKHFNYELGKFIGVDKRRKEEQSNGLPEKRGKRGAAKTALKKFKPSKNKKVEDDTIEKARALLKEIRETREKQQFTDSPSSGKKRQKKSQTFDHGFQEQSTCFLCGEHLIGDLGDINRHIDRCLLKSENPSRASSPPPDQFEDSFDYYTWGDETRIRPTSLLMGGLAANGIHTVKASISELDEEVEIEEDDEQIFGEPQVTDRDLILPENDDEAPILREKMLITPQQLPKIRLKISNPASETNPDPNSNPCLVVNIDSSQSQPQSNSNIKPLNDPNVNLTTNMDASSIRNSNLNSNSNSNSTSTPSIPSTPKLNTLISPSSTLVIEALKQRIRDLEEELAISNGGENKKGNTCFKCQICLSAFNDPAVSVRCWHVHCMDCWLRTLGAKKLCPQCLVITSPTELRRIYL